MSKTPTNWSLSHRRAATLVAAMVMLAAGPAESAIWHWNNGGTDNNWSTGGNWEGGTAPNTGWDHIFFGATTVELHGTTSDIDVPYVVASFLVNDFTYGQDDPSNVGFSGTINVQSPLTVEGNYFWIRPDTLGVTGMPGFNNTSTITIDGMGTTIIDQVGVNLGDVVIESSVQLRTAVTMTSVTINNGQLRLDGGEDPFCGGETMGLV